MFLRWINKLSTPRPVWGGINTLTGWGGAAADEVGGVQLNIQSNRDGPGLRIEALAPELRPELARSVAGISPGIKPKLNLNKGACTT